ncbi:unnamed protein product [Caenorhabditis angaria]|uniref:Uncharacterized protein n=1 Tax=Caenorhabditis angaria TaxID=860376 RepID=A0A9P1NCU2_9PELO|nr:unnamed protein product [Caenorhabditis angaria]
MSLDNSTENNDFGNSSGEYLINHIPRDIGFYCSIPFIILVLTTPNEERKSIIYPIYKTICNLILGYFSSYIYILLAAFMYTRCLDPGLILGVFYGFLFVLPHIFGGNGSNMLFFLLIGVQRIVVILNFDKLEKYVQGKYLNRALNFIIFWTIALNFIDLTNCPIQNYCAVYSTIKNDFECNKNAFMTLKSKTSFYTYACFDIMIPAVSLAIHIILLHAIHKNRHILSETRRKSELAIIFQNLPLCIYFIAQMIGIIFYFIIQTPSPYIQSLIKSMICRDSTNFNSFPVTYTIAHWKRLRNIMCCCKCSKNRVYIDNLATSVPGN